MGLTSFHFYTSVGLDLDRHAEPANLEAHVRLRWPGNGSFLVGADQYWLPAERPLTLVDPGAALFQAPRRPPPRSVWNRLGFWLIREQHPPTELPVRGPEKASAAWVGVPSGVPVLLAGLWPWRRWRRDRSRRG